MTKLLPPVRINKTDVETLEKKILNVLRIEVYKPILKVLKRTPKILNAIDDLVSAIVAGHIRYVDTGFVGVFSANVSKELKKLGAVWSPRNYKFMIGKDKLPDMVIAAIPVSGIRDTELRETVLETVASIPAVEPDFTKYFEVAIGNVDKAVQKSAKSLVVTPELSEFETYKLAEEYTENLKKYIKDFTTEETLRLRKQIEAHVFKGNRYEDLIQLIKSSYAISQRKAKFLARQETNLLTAKVRESRYADAGIDSYVWQAVAGTPAHPTRPMHKKLDGTVQKFSSPPISNPQGQRNNPGTDYNCRCVARPIVKF